MTPRRLLDAPQEQARATHLCFFFLLSFLCRIFITTTRSHLDNDYFDECFRRRFPLSTEQLTARYEPVLMDVESIQVSVPPSILAISQGSALREHRSRQPVNCFVHPALNEHRADPMMESLGPLSISLQRSSFDFARSSSGFFVDAGDSSCRIFTPSQVV